MALKGLLVAVLVALAISAASLIFTLFTVNPFKASLAVILLFYFSLGLFLLSLFFYVSFKIFQKTALDVLPTKIASNAFRLSALLTGIIMIVLLLFKL